MKNPKPKNEPYKFIPFVYPIRVKHKLERCSVDSKADFLEILMSRRSRSDFSSISIKEVSELLYLSTKIQSIKIDSSGFVLTKRTSPSGGARHPIDLLVSLAEPIDKRTLSYYNPLDHSLAELLFPKKQLLEDFFNEISQNMSIQNACIIWFSIQHEKTSSKYENPESLYWKDVGALLYCIQLIATYLGYKSCPLGSLAMGSFDNLFDSPKIISGGGVLIGK